MTNLEMAGQGVYDLVGADMSKDMDAAAVGGLERPGLERPARIELLPCADGRAEELVDVQRRAVGILRSRRSRLDPAAVWPPAISSG